LSLLCGVLPVDNALVRLLDRRSHVTLVLLGGAVALGGAGALLGPAQAAAGVLAGPFIALAGAVVVQVFTTADPAGLAGAGRHREALWLIDREMPGLRVLAKIWPAQFRDTLADRLLERSLALHAALRDDEALTAAQEGVAMHRGLAAARLGRPAPGLGPGAD
jgi:hypothetical protein